MPLHGEEYKDIMSDFEKKIMPGIVHWNHPNFFAYFGSGNAYPSLLGEMLSSATGSLGFSWASSPALTELETIVLDWFAKALDLPDFFLSKHSNPESVGGGVIQSSASDSIFACLIAARARAIKKLKGDNEEIHDSVYLPRLVCYSSSEAHSCIQKAAKLNMIKMRVIQPDQHDSMRGDNLEEMIVQDINKGLYPFFVVATSGTTSQGAFDNLAEIGQVCKKYPSIWLHVDGAYGGNSFILPEMRKFKEGLEFADSFEVNPNKLLLTSYDATCMWIKDVYTFTCAFAIDPLYLQHQHTADVVDLRHFGSALSRRFRALKLYFMFRMYGLEKLQTFVRRVIAMGKYFEQLVIADGRFEVRNEVHVGLVCFRLIQPDSVNQELLARLNASGKIHLTPAIVKGHYTIRFVACQEYVDEKIIENGWKTIKEFAEEIIKGIAAPTVSTAAQPLRMFDDPHTQRFSFTRFMPPELFAMQPKM